MFDLDVLYAGADGDQEGHSDALTLATLTLNAPINDVPRGPALVLAPEASVATAVREMRARNRTAVVVVRQQKPVGVVTDGDILGQACGDLESLDQVPVEALMATCAPLRETASVGVALRRMCSTRRWHLPLVCARGLLLGSVDVTDVSLWLRDRMTLLSIDAALGQAWARGG